MQPLDAEKQAMAEGVLNRADRLASRYARIFPEYADDIESSAHWGAVRAASGYVPDLGQTWERWSKLCIRGEIREFLRCSWVRHHTNAGLTQAQIKDLEDKREDPGDEVVSRAESMDTLLAMLTPRQREVCGLVYRDGMTPTEAGRALGVDGRRGCHLHEEAIERLKDILLN